MAVYPNYHGPTLSLLIICLLLPCSDGFPNSGNPIAAEPPTTHPAAQLCSVRLITNASCDGWGKVISQPYSPPLPDQCQGIIEKAILEVKGSVKGVQYDRFGALFLGSVELLRTSTPEPPPNGIHWSIEKDVTRYLSLFLSSGPQTARLAIPNNVDSTYTGIFYIQARLIFYGEPTGSNPAAVAPSLRASENKAAAYDAQQQQQQQPPSSPPKQQAPHNTRRIAPAPLVVPLVDPFKDGWPWSTLGITGNQSLNATVDWPASNVVRATLDVYASNHQCEEFFYTNVPDEYAQDLGFCGGGVYREIQVYVNGVLAGITYPYLVIYTGGINPLLWRPLTGIMSFDIGPYRFDLTPFVGLLNQAEDGQVEISIRVLGNNGDTGLWFVNGVLLLHTDEEYEGQVLPGTLLAAADTGAQMHVGHHVHLRDTVFVTSGSHAFSVSGMIEYPNGTTVVTTVATELTATNTNKLLGSTTQISVGLMLSDTTVVTGDSIVHTVDRWPYNITNSYDEDDTTMDMSAEVRLTFERSLKMLLPISSPSSSSSAATGGKSSSSSKGFSSFHSHWYNDIGTSAVYNRTLDHSHINIQSGVGSEQFGISTSRQGSCYHRELHSTAGWVDLDVGTYNCVLPAGLSFCEYQICPSGGSGQTKVMVRDGGGEGLRVGAVRTAELGGGGGLKLHGRNALHRARTGRVGFH